MSRTLTEWVDLYPGTRNDLAAAIGRSRRTIHYLEHGCFRRAPLRVLCELEAAMRDDPPSDGTPAPTLVDLVRAFQVARAEREAILAAKKADTSADMSGHVRSVPIGDPIGDAP